MLERRGLGRPELAVLGAFALAIAIGFTWGLPGTNTWAVDSISPRSCGLGAIVETYWPGHYHTYPALHTALLTLLSTPWIALAAARVGLAREALGQELVKPFYMTGIELGARAVAAAMALAFVWNTMRWWTRIRGRVAGVAAGAIVAANATLVYYAHTGNLEAPYLFWAGWALLEMDRTLAGEPRERQALLLSAAAVLSKDQAAAVLLLPLAAAVVVVPWVARGESLLRRRLLTSIALGSLFYGLVSGAIVNPVGFRRRIAFLLGPASQTWALYPRGLQGTLDLARDALRALPHFTSWPIAGAAVAGVAIALFVPRGTSSPGVARVRLLLPLLASLSFTLLFTLGARRSEDRFLLPQTLFAVPYAAVLVAWAWERWPKARSLLFAVAGGSLVPALLEVASLDGTLLVDSRYEAERFLASLPPHTHVEVLGTSLFLPRMPDTLDVARPGTDPIDERQAVPGFREILDPAMDPRPRAPEFIVLATVLSLELVTAPPPPPERRPYGSTAYHDEASHRLFRGLFDGSLGYDRALTACCALPWPLECRGVHDATGREVWIYRERAP
ncbi:MAG TPA: hypothetical protein VH044_13095 [Polyangiaceae bacterium]|nr:hypothetical protein [Polyangiaceae bacterium]